VVIVTEAGGRVTDAKGNELDFSRGRWLDLEVRFKESDANHTHSRRPLGDVVERGCCSPLAEVVLHRRFSL
jgi:3'-phosphoadenosine 5'-phosphosulfate (PAPS) 3'-phosphatase